MSPNGKRLGRPPNYLRNPLPIPEDSHGLGRDSLSVVIGVFNDLIWHRKQDEMRRTREENARLRGIIEGRKYLGRGWHLSTVPKADVAKEALRVADRPL